MHSFRESRNFMWYTSESDELGRGSFGIVYRGIDKINGDPVAVKIPHSNVAIPEDIERREIEVYQRINHKNICKLLGYEEERPSGYHRRDRPVKALVMELCDGGSLFKILEHPMNHFGLEEDEFLAVLRDLTSGMKYLRENDMIHRDLKPANIMRCISDDGSSIYKITDFGAARELPENQEYSSIFGTEEYLHPDVYEQALLPDTTIPKKKFSPSTDLWSIGATLYHVATGMLPFRPIDGRKNRKVMHLMTTKKASGVISAYQVSKEPEQIVFEERLPKNCLLSPDLKRLLCPLLAGLMEVDPRKKLTFESYFRKVEDILGRKQLHVFHINKLHLVRLYVHPNETRRFDDLAALIAAYTKVPAEDQILLFKDSTLKAILDTDAQCDDICSKLPKTSETNPVVLCNRSDTEVIFKHEKFPLKKKLFPNTVDYKTDANVAIHNCLVANVIKRLIRAACLKAKLIDSSVQTINQVVVAQLTAASKENILIRKAVHSMKNQFEMMQCFHTLCTKFAKLIPEDISNPSCGEGEGNRPTFHDSVKQLNEIYSSQFHEFQKLDNMLLRLKPSLDALFGSRVQNRFLMNSWEEASTKVKGVNEFLRIERISTTLVSNIEQSYADFTGDLPSLTPHRRRAPMPEEECLHLIERTKMIQTMEKLERLLTECLTNLSSFSSIVSDWYKQAIIAAYIQPEILTNHIRDLQGKITRAEENLVKDVNNFKVQLGEVTKTLSAFPIVAGSIENIQNHTKSAKAKAVRDRLHELKKVQEEIQSKFEINSALCDQLQGLLLTSFSEANANTTS